MNGVKAGVLRASDWAVWKPVRKLAGLSGLITAGWCLTCRAINSRKQRLQKWRSADTGEACLLLGEALEAAFVSAPELVEVPQLDHVDLRQRRREHGVAEIRGILRDPALCDPSDDPSIRCSSKRFRSKCTNAWPCTRKHVPLRVKIWGAAGWPNATFSGLTKAARGSLGQTF